MIDRGAPFLIAGDMSGVRMSKATAGIAKVTGMEPGDPDLRVYLPNGRLGLIEYKAAAGRLSPAQKIRHVVLRSLGHQVEVVKAATEEDARSQTVAIVLGWLAANDNAPVVAQRKAS
ncbi:VRR-NUC domain-containing protein [Hansschlegelia beijingensis]|uniref:VRR-NUC domain-containing protein n=1 Tax=Hansschlegelia beijingensis TaxID=1133344 RepID=A0A7W6D167_9HYPH|nr:VRR-NUC domain-containing protein [Hansschlegelia beijingensis]MBB3972761.1 hypothetical protein [Hansschlegelia beijingensis]